MKDMSYLWRTIRLDLLGDFRKNTDKNQVNFSRDTNQFVEARSQIRFKLEDLIEPIEDRLHEELFKDDLPFWK